MKTTPAITEVIWENIRPSSISNCIYYAKLNIFGIRERELGFGFNYLIIQYLGLLFDIPGHFLRNSVVILLENFIREMNLLWELIANWNPLSLKIRYSCPAINPTVLFSIFIFSIINYQLIEKLHAFIYL